MSIQAFHSNDDALCQREDVYSHAPQPMWLHHPHCLCRISSEEDHHRSKLFYNTPHGTTTKASEEQSQLEYFSRQISRLPLSLAAQTQLASLHLFLGIRALPPLAFFVDTSLRSFHFGVLAHFHLLVAFSPGHNCQLEMTVTVHFTSYPLTTRRSPPSSKYYGPKKDCLCRPASQK